MVVGLAWGKSEKLVPLRQDPLCFEALGLGTTVVQDRKPIDRPG